MSQAMPAPTTTPQGSQEPTSNDQQRLPSPRPAETHNNFNTTTTPHTPIASQPPTQTLARRLDAGEDLWVWKLGLRAAAIVVGIVGTACFAWGLATTPNGPYSSDLDYSWGFPWTIITFGVSAVFCSVCILVLLLRRPNRPVHPGVAVGMDLLLWMGLAITGTFALMCVTSIMSFGSHGIIGGYYSSEGRFEQSLNGTWVWAREEEDYYYGTPRSCDQSSYNSYSYGGAVGSYTFDSCADVDKWVNHLWSLKSKRVTTLMVGVVCQYLSMVLHLILFIWACVDTHRRNENKVSKDAELLATDIVMKMIKSGAVVPGPNQSTAQQSLLQNAQMPQGWMPVPMAPQPAMVGPEKGEVSRFA
ncbi:hypothetical protein M011DRAFT_15521 [Sporormia fimetaria CBS 119925]|uniref:Uncharacterized protein n=1 Tax=Sporormia fimetaria CBS 119925 TaxID=1340428 RepID=A0A6A6VS27_9PLEO|nr:hypothetical protein M011DRAFT_15521 [Sporormia fimetaria CBS 119925]